MLRGTEIVYIKFVLKFFKITWLWWSVFLPFCRVFVGGAGAGTWCLPGEPWAGAVDAPQEWVALPELRWVNGLVKNSLAVIRGRFYSFSLPAAH